MHEKRWEGGRKRRREEGREGGRREEKRKGIKQQEKRGEGREISHWGVKVGRENEGSQPIREEEGCFSLSLVSVMEKRRRKGGSFG